MEESPPMRQWHLLLIFSLAVGLLFVLPNPESLIVKVVERAGLVLIVARGFMGHYQDFRDTMNGSKRRR